MLGEDMPLRENIRLPIPGASARFQLVVFQTLCLPAFYCIIHFVILPRVETDFFNIAHSKKR
jgi:hypothetical protein